MQTKLWNLLDVIVNFTRYHALLDVTKLKHLMQKYKKIL